MPSEYTKIPFPIHGMVRRTAYQDQPPLTTPNCVNVRVADPLLQRERGGSRPGLHKLYTSQVGAPSPVNLITDIEWVTGGATAVLGLVGSNGTLYQDGSAHTYATALTAVGTQSCTLRSDITLTAANVLQKVYIAGGDNSSNKYCAVYDPSGDSLVTLHSVKTAGNDPIKCRIACAYRNRLVLAWDEVSPQLVYLSKQNDPTNWDYTATGSGAAVTLETSLAGDIAHPVRALAPWKDSRLIVGCVSSLWVLEGDPLFGGRINRLSDKVGIVDKMAWTFGPAGELYFLSWDGLYVLVGNEVEAISRDVLPQELYALDPSTYYITMAYDTWHRGLHICAAPVSAGSVPTVWYWVTFNGKRPAFWNQSFGTTSHEPVVMWTMRPNTPSSATDSLVIYGCRDRYTRIHDRTNGQDDGVDIATAVEIGPFPIGKPGYNGKLSELKLTLAANSGKVGCGVMVGNNAEAAVNASVFASRTFSSPGVNATMRPRARGNSAVIDLTGYDSSPSTRWAMEELLVKIEPAGKVRVAS